MGVTARSVWECDRCGKRMAEDMAPSGDYRKHDWPLFYKRGWKLTPFSSAKGNADATYCSAKCRDETPLSALENKVQKLVDRISTLEMLAR